ncbi:MAG: hypothetical protein GWP15_00985 [Nitrospirae bacterium]|nr:hypothetical protein [Nitrospirota bacterium]
MANPEGNVSVETVLDGVLALKGHRQYEKYYRVLDSAIESLRQEIGQTALNYPVLDPEKAKDIGDTLQFAIVGTETHEYTLNGNQAEYDVRVINQEALDKVIAAIKVATSSAQQ